MHYLINIIHFPFYEIASSDNKITQNINKTKHFINKMQKCTKINFLKLKGIIVKHIHYIYDYNTN